MHWKLASIVTIAALLIAVASAVVNLPKTSAWSNGGYSADPANPDYGTHDWIAQHALDFLPQGERQFIEDNLANFLYGTELPDNDEAPDRVNDKTKHHVYFFGNGTLQDDAAALRAQEEYEVALSLFKAGNECEAAKHLGIMTHYIADLGVYAHVMGVATEWGAENNENHSNYEEYVQTRTNNYTDDFNSYLAFDGTLNETSPYNSVLALAKDTTFDSGRGLSCAWMDQNFNWSNPTFKNRVGESLNLAVNVVADMLHGFHAQTVIPEFPSVFAFVLIALLAIPGTVLLRRKLFFQNKH